METELLEESIDGRRLKSSLGVSSASDDRSRMETLGLPPFGCEAEESLSDNVSNLSILFWTLREDLIGLMRSSMTAVPFWSVFERHSDCNLKKRLSFARQLRL